MRPQRFWISIVLVVCACSATAPTGPSAPAASSTAPSPSSTTSPASSASPAPGSSTAGAALSGSVWRDVCDGSSAQQPPPTTPPPGCVAAPAGGFVADGTRAADEPPIAGVRVTLGTGACPAEPTGSTETTAEGQWTFGNLPPGTYCVTADSLDEANLPLLLPGSWTAPADAATNSAASATVTLGAGEQRTDISFGWDYQLLP